MTIPLIPLIHKNTSPGMIAGLRDIESHFDAAILDIFGVLHDGLALYPETVPCLTAMKQAGKTICLVSNTPRLGPDIERDLAAMGLPRDLYDGIVTAGDSARREIANYAGKKCWFAGTEKFLALVDGFGIKTAESLETADFILNAITSGYVPTAEEIRRHWQAGLSRGLPMICANPDLVVNIGDTQYVCAGTYALYYEQAGGTVSYHGKPHAPVYERAWEILGRPGKGRIVAVGDSLDTDIQGANNFGIFSVFNLIGIHWEQLRLDHEPSAADMGKVLRLVQSQAHHPSAVMCGLSW